MPFVSVQVIIVGDAGANAAVQTVSHKFDGIAPDIDQSVAAFVVDPPETSASDLVVAAGKEDDFIAADDPPVSPVQDGNAELVHPDVTSVPKLLPIADAEDVDPSSVRMVIAVVMTVPSGRGWRRGRLTVRTVMAVSVLMMGFRRGRRCSVGIMTRLSRCTGNGEEQCDAEYLSFHGVFLLFCPIKMQLSDQNMSINVLQWQKGLSGTEYSNVRIFFISLEISRFVLLKRI